MTILTKDLLQELFDYKKGQLIRRVSRGNAKVGDIAGSLNTNGYVAIQVNGSIYKAHRLIWMWHNGEVPEGLEIDHINGVKDDNSIDNLRPVTHQENSFNTTTKGYGWHKQHNKFQAYIKTNNKTKYLGLFDDEKDAHQAYLDAKSKLHIIEVAA